MCIRLCKGPLSENMTTVFVNNTDLLHPDWRFIEPFWSDPRATWDFYHGVPRNWIEARIRRPHLGRYRAALQAVRAARTQRARSVLVSHLPAMAAATNILRRQLCPEVRQIAFAFNFTALPTGRRLSYFRRALQGIDEFVVFSQMEREVYAEAFDLPPERFHMLPWAADAPVVGPDNPVPFEGPYLCAIGGEGREYGLLAAVMRDRPQARMVVDASPSSVAGIEFPENVTLFTNLPGPQTWRLAKDSQGLVIPLKTADTACGHITLVGAQHLGIPLAITRSRGVSDYVDDQTAFLVPPQDNAALTQAIVTLDGAEASVDARRKKAQETAQTRSSLTGWVQYFEDQLDRSPSSAAR